MSGLGGTAARGRGAQQVPPLRVASVGMTKFRAVLPIDLCDEGCSKLFAALLWNSTSGLAGLWTPLAKADWKRRPKLCHPEGPAVRLSLSQPHTKAPAPLSKGQADRL